MPQDPRNDERDTRLKTPKDCGQFAINVADRLPELASAAKRRAVELKAASHGANTDAELKALSAVYAYERVLSGKRGKTVRASRTWQMIDRHGIIEAVERAVKRNDDPLGYQALVEMNLHDLAFEAVVLQYPTEFSNDAIEHSRKWIEKWSNAPSVDA